jgi:AcrR family transcriptional regulator
LSEEFPLEESTHLVTITRPDDPRVLRTREALVGALLALCEEKNLDEITVKEVSHLASVNRNTFYRHFGNKDELVATAFDALIDQITLTSRVSLARHEQLDPAIVPSSTASIFAEIGKRPALYVKLIAEGGSPEFATRMRMFYERQFLRRWADLGMVAAPGSPPAELRAGFSASSMESVVRWWLTNGLPVSAAEVAAWAWQLLSELWLPKPTPLPVVLATDE